MPQNVVNKRRNIATNAVIYATQLADAINGLKELQVERNEMGAGGAYEQADFDDTDLTHLTPYITEVLLGDVTNNFKATFDVALNKAILMQARK